MGKQNKKRKKHKGSKSGKPRTPISGHTHKGKELLPPIAKAPTRVAFVSWMNDRLPEMLWAALIRVSSNQDCALSQFRRILTYIERHEQRELLSDITLTGLSKLDARLREEVITFILGPPEASEPLVALRLFQTLPARESWDKLLPPLKPDVRLLMRAVGATLSDQSQEATDCRWLRLMARLLAGTL